MKDDRTNHVIEAIDGALGDWEVSEDAMRWAPDPPPKQLAPAAGQLLSGPILHHTATPPWVLGMRVVEDPDIGPGEVLISVDDTFDDIRHQGAVFRRVVVERTARARIQPGLTDEARTALIERIAGAYDVPPCLIEHRWSDWTGVPGPFRRDCTREGCGAWEDQWGGYHGVVRP